MKFLNNNEAVSQAMGFVKDQTKIPPVIQLCIIIMLTGLWLIFGHGAALLSNLIAIIYPTYKSIGAIESPNKEDHKQWLMYWTIFAVFSCSDLFILNILGLSYYYLLKSIFLIWCYLPIEQNGSLVLYNYLVLGIFVKYHEEINETLKQVTEQITKTGKVTAAKMTEVGKGAAKKITEKGREVVEKVNGRRMRGNSAVVVDEGQE